jgi:hypothetical protein
MGDKLATRTLGSNVVSKTFSIKTTKIHHELEHHYNSFYQTVGGCDAIGP